MTMKGMAAYRRCLGLVALMALCSALAGSSTGLQWRWAFPSPSGAAFYAVAYGNGKYVAAGGDGALFSSPDGSTWTSHSNAIGSGGAWMDALYANGLFLVAGFDADRGTHVAVSSDGSTWTDIPLALNFSLQPILYYTSGTYMLLSSDAIATSSDGHKWQVHKLGFSSFCGLGSVSGVLVICGGGGIYLSTDLGRTWTKTTTPVIQSGGFYELAGDGTHLLLTESEYDPVSGQVTGVTVLGSRDGAHWTTEKPAGAIPGFGNGPVPLMWDGTQFFTITTTLGDYADYDAFTSPDGITWTDRGNVRADLPFVGSFFVSHPAAVTGSGYLAIGAGPLVTYTSSDLVHWTADALATAPTDSLMISAAQSKGTFVMAGEDLYASSDGVNWSQVYSYGNRLGGLVGGGGRFVAAYTNVAYMGRYDGYSVNGWLDSADGRSWNTPTRSPAEGAIADLAYGNGVFGAFTGACDNLDIKACTDVAFETSSDGNTWVSHSLPPPMLSAGAYSNLSFFQGRFTAIGQAGPDGVATLFGSADGSNWTALGSVDVGFPGTYFTRLRAVNTQLWAMNSSDFSVISPRWTASNFTYAKDKWFPLFDLIYDGKQLVDSSGLVSTDGIHWCRSNTMPWQFTTSGAIASDGHSVVLGGRNQDIDTAGIAVAPVPSSAISCAAATADYSLVTVASKSGGTGGAKGGPSSGGGTLSLLILAGLLGFTAMRPRVGHRNLQSTD